jgi:alpha-beta hydrolase superfamily lysophospholipase/thiol-disulfide isomerase/thioredoxin
MQVRLYRRSAAMLIACLICLANLTGFGTWSAAVAHDKDKNKQADQAAAPTGSAAAPCISWVNPLVKPKVALLCIHGLGLFSGSYQNFGMRMAARGIAVYAIDVRGFGSWMKSQGNEQIDFNASLQDVKAALTAIRQSNPGLPVFLMGESMGGAIALRAASMYPDLIDGLISSVPAGDRFQQKKTDLKVAYEFLKGPNKQFDIGSKIVGQATQNPAEKKDWEENPLDRMDLSAKELIQFQKFMNENHEAAKNIKDTPVLFVQGTQDRLVKPEGTWELFNELTTPDKYFLAVPSEHLIFEEWQAKPYKFDSRVAHLTANWIFMMAAKTATATMAGDLEQSASGQAGHAVDPRLSDGIKAFVQGNYSAALPLIKAAEDSDPENSEAHYWLGMCYSKLRQPVEARREMVRALALGRGSIHSQQANNYLIASGDGGPDDPSNGKAAPVSVVNPVAKDLTNGDPAVLAFCASWAEQCQPIDNFFKQAKNMFGDKVRLVKVDVEDHKNDDIVKAFNVGPVPTVVYLDSSGKVVSTSIGRTSFANFAKGISGIIR